MSDPKRFYCICGAYFRPGPQAHDHRHTDGHPAVRWISYAEWQRLFKDDGAEWAYADHTAIY